MVRSWPYHSAPFPLPNGVAFKAAPSAVMPPAAVRPGVDLAWPERALRGFFALRTDLVTGARRCVACVGRFRLSGSTELRAYAGAACDAGGPAAVQQRAFDGSYVLIRQERTRQWL